MSPATTGGSPISALSTMRTMACPGNGHTATPAPSGKPHCRQAHSERQTDNGHEIMVKANQEAKGCAKGRTEIIHGVRAPRRAATNANKNPCTKPTLRGVRLCLLRVFKAIA